MILHGAYQKTDPKADGQHPKNCWCNNRIDDKRRDRKFLLVIIVDIVAAIIVNTTNTKSARKDNSLVSPAMETFFTS